MTTIDFSVSDYIQERALQALEDGRVSQITARGDCSQLGAWVRAPGRVLPPTIYTVWFLPEGVQCDCYAGSDHGPTEPRCYHAVAAMILWAETIAAYEAVPDGFI